MTKSIKLYQRKELKDLNTKQIRKAVEAEYSISLSDNKTEFKMLVEVFTCLKNNLKYEF